MRNSTLLGLFICALLSPATAQDGDIPLRRWVTGKVLRVDGSPWTDAAVTLFSRPWGLLSGRGFEDRVETRSDTRGNFKAKVLTVRTYSVWALGPVVNGQYRMAKVVDGVSAGVPVALRELPVPRMQVRVEVTGREAWRKVSGLRYEVSFMMGNDLVLPCEIEDGVVVIPPLPKVYAFLTVRTENMLPIGSGIISLFPRARRKQLDDPDARDLNERLSRAKARISTLTMSRSRIELPPPASLRVRVSGEDGKPLAGATLYHRDRSEMHPVANTDADGIARLMVPRTMGTADAPMADHLGFWVQGKGHILGNYYQWKVPLGNAKADVELQLYRGTSITGRVMWSADRPAARIPIMLHSWVPSSGGGAFNKNTKTYGGNPTVYWTDDDGHFEIPGRPGFLSWQLTTFLRGDEPRHLRRSRRFPLFSRMVLASGWDREGKDEDLGTMTLSDYQPLDVEILDEKGRPAVGVGLRFREKQSPPKGTTRTAVDRVGYAETNWAGQVRFLCRPGTTMLLRPEWKGRPTQEHEVVIVKGAKEPTVARIRAAPSPSR